jgi:hypothetical protein
LVQVIGALLPLIAVFALVFGPLAGRLALERQRQPIVWLIFGALLGPIALALLILAPPGACPRCNERVRGWPSDCPLCGEYLTPPFAARLGRVFADDEAPVLPVMPQPTPIPIRQHGPIAPAATVTRPRPELQSSVHERTPDPLDSISIQPEPGWTARLATLARGPVVPHANGNGMSTGNETTIHGTEGMATGNESSSPASGLARFSAQIFLPPPGPLDPPTEDPTIVAVGVYVSGTERLTIAGRYAIGHAHGRLKVLGPYETNPRKLAVDWDLTAIEVGQGEGQLVVARTHGRRARVLTFRLLSTFNRAVLDAAIVAATHSAGAKR